MRLPEAGFAGARGSWCLRLMKQRSGYDALMHEVCVERGRCGGIVDGRPSHVDDLIPEEGPVTANQFVVWLFMADGMLPHAEQAKLREHKQGLRDAFIRHMGHDTIDAPSLKRALD